MEHINRTVDSYFVLNNNESIPISIRNRKSIEKTFSHYIFEGMVNR